MKHKSEQPIRNQISKLTQLLTMTTTHKVSVPGVQGLRVRVRPAARLRLRPRPPQRRDGKKTIRACTYFWLKSLKIRYIETSRL